MKLDKKSRLPLYHQVYEILREQIEKGILHAGSFVGSEKQLSIDYAISRMTARSALKKLEMDGYISCNGSLGRQVNSLNLKQSIDSLEECHDSNICIAVYPFEVYHYDVFYYREIIDGLSNTAAQLKINLCFLSNEDLRKGETIKKLMDRNMISGVIWCKNTLDDNFNELRRYNIPVIVLNQASSNGDFDYVTTNHYQGTYFIINCLVHMGHKKIAYLGSPKKTWNQEQRKKAYCDIIKKYDFPLNDSWIIESNADDICEFDIFKEKNRPTAIFVSGGLLLSPAFVSLSARGLDVPRDISLVSIDSPSYKERIVSGMEQPCEKMASIALSHLVRNVKGIQNPIAIELDQIFMPGETCDFNKEKIFF